MLPVFQKKSKRGIGTPKKEMELIQARLQAAQVDHAHWLSVSTED